MKLVEIWQIIGLMLSIKNNLTNIRKTYGLSQR